MPKVSVIIPCYNQLAYIAEAIDSVKRQLFTDYEIIIINDGSTENDAVEFLNKFADHSTVVLHIANCGVSAARNYAIKQSTGTYILPLDADDCITEQFLNATVAILDTLPEVEAVRTGVKYFGLINHEEMLPVYSRRRHLQQNVFVNTTLFRKSSFLNVGGYDEKFAVGWEDWDFFLRLVERESQVYTIEKPYFLYRIKPSSRNADLLHDLRCKAEQQLFKKYLDLYLQFYPEPLSQIREIEFLTKEKSNFEQVKQSIYQSASYRLGHALLRPVKWIKRFINR